MSMADSVEITVMNKLIKERRDINVYHHFNKSAHILSCNSSLAYGIKLAEEVEESDYLHISVVSGPGYLKQYSIVDIPWFVDFRILLSGEEVVLVHRGERMLLRVPPGPPVWQVKLSIPGRIAGVLNGNYIAVGDIDEGAEHFFGDL